MTAICVAIFGVWAFFFSPASTALINYLHSELTVRNLRIMELEGQERDLRSSIANREKELTLIEQKTTQLQTELSDLSDQRDLLQKQISAAEEERSRLESQVSGLGASLSRSEFDLVKQKIYTKLSSTFVSTLALRVIDEFGTPEGIKPRRANIWDDYVASIRSSVSELADAERSVGEDVFKLFLLRCGDLKKMYVDLPALKHPRRDFAGYASASEEERRRRDADAKDREEQASKRLDALTQRILDLEERVKTCFKGLSRS